MALFESDGTVTVLFTDTVVLHDLVLCCCVGHTFKVHALWFYLIAIQQSSTIQEFYLVFRLLHVHDKCVRMYIFAIEYINHRDR